MTMETTAKYRLMGAFTLVAVLSVFAFIYWLNHGGGLAERTAYQIKFIGAVPGLRAGAAVQFNGIRVGEVTDLRLDTKTPQQVFVTIAVERGTPIRADTQVSLDFQGLMGVTSVALKGGAAQSLPLTGTTGNPPLLIADAAAGADLTTTAREALKRLDGILADNADSLKSTISNLNVFTGALAKNSDRIDGIVAGIERMTAGESAKPQSVSFDLSVPGQFPPSDKRSGQIAVAEPTALIVFDSQKLIARSAAGARSPLSGNGQWTDSLPKLVQAKIVQTLENALSPSAVIRASDGVTAERQLFIEIRSFELQAGDPPLGRVEFAARIVGEGNRVLGARTFGATVSASSGDIAAAASALDEAFGRVATDMANWVRGLPADPP
jgi:phospholipid/cholesterol/gamma-HCH transport system substrate-binding protein